MSQSPSTSSSSSNFRTIFVAAIKAYEKKTKTDLHTHPLATQLQSCSSSSDILAVLLDKVNEFEKSRSHNEKLSSWLGPTINVLYAFSSTVGQGVGLVSLNGSTLRPTIIVHFLSQIFSPANVISAGIGILFLVRILPNRFLEVFSTLKSVRLPRTSAQVKKPLPISSTGSRTSSNDSNHIQKCHQQMR